MAHNIPRELMRPRVCELLRQLRSGKQIILSIWAVEADCIRDRREAPHLGVPEAPVIKEEAGETQEASPAAAGHQAHLTVTDLAMPELPVVAAPV